MKKPNLFLVGHPRTGSSALHDSLNRHPDIFMSFPKEPVYFAKDLHKDSDHFHKKTKYFHFRDEDQYLKLFEKSTHQKIIGESTAVYLYSKSAAGEIHNFNPSAKIIMMFREPVSWLYSFHSKACQILGEDQIEIKKALLLENKRKQGKHLSPEVLAPSILYYTNFIKYKDQVQRYLNVFNRTNVKIIIYDDFRNENRKIYKEILEFLDVEPDIVPELKKINVSKSNPKWPIAQRVIQSPRIIKMALTLLPRDLYAKITRIYWDKFFNPMLEPSIEKDFKKQLMKKFKPEVELLTDFLNRDLMNLWGYDKI